MDQLCRLNQWLSAVLLSSLSLVLPLTAQSTASTGPHPVVASEYGAGIRAMNENQWDRAVTFFGKAAIEPNGVHADASLYWKAYSYRRLQLRRQSMQTCALLRSSYPSSTWNQDCEALLLEMKQNPSSFSVRSENELAPIPRSEENIRSDDDLKLLALNALIHSAPSDGVAAARAMLLSHNESATKNQVLFALSQSTSQEAVSLLKEAMTGKFGAATQEQAIRAVTQYSSIKAPELAVGVYRTTSSKSTKEAIIAALSVWQDWDDLVALARAEHDADLKRQMVLALSKSNRPVALQFLKDLLR